MTTVRDTRNSLQRRTVLAMAASCLAGLALAPRAEAADLVDLRIVDRETGETARVWSHAGRLFVAGRPGARYALRVSNNTGGRVLVVLSVDGINILTGQTAAYGQRGYVLGPYESYDASGWRKSDTEVAAFTFTALSRSYAARTGRPDDVGVIGVAAFTERYVPPPVAVAPQAQSSSRDQSAEAVVVTGSRIGGAAPPPPAIALPAPAAAPPSQPAEPRPERLGTGHGAREYSLVRTVAFERASAYPQLIRRIEYDSAENLVAAGIIPRPRPRPRAPLPPRPFPDQGYVPDPPYER